MQPGGPSKREALKSDQQGRGHRSIPETSGRVYVYGKPVDAGGPVWTARAHTRKPNHAGGQLQTQPGSPTGGRAAAMIIK